MSESETTTAVEQDVNEQAVEEDGGTSPNKNITVIKVKPMAATSTTEDTRLLCLVPVADPMAATSTTTEEAEAGDPTQVHKNLAEIQDAQNEVRKLDVLVCGKCHLVFHFIEEFTEHKSDPSCSKPTYRTNINESKPQVWAFLLWKANVGSKLSVDSADDDGVSNSSWGLYKRWCKLQPHTRDTWVAAGKAIQVSSALGAATIKQVHSYPVLDPTKAKRAEEVFTYTDSVRAGKNIKPVPSQRAVRTAIKRPLTGKAEDGTAEPRVKVARASADAGKPKATRSSSLRGKRPDGCEADSSEEENYVVEKILAKRFNPRIKQFEYLLKWEGYPQDQNTWEPVDHMAECDKLVETFERSLAKQKAKAAEAGHKVVTKVVKVPLQVKPGTSQESGGRPVRSSKTRALENVKSWCGSIGGKGVVADNSDSDESEPKVKTEYFDPNDLEDHEETKTPGLLKSLSLVKSPGRPKVVRAVNGEQKARPAAPTPPVLVANAKGVIKVDSRQVSTLSSGVYIVSNQAGTMKLGQEKTQPRLLPKPSPTKTATGLVRVPSPAIQKSLQAAQIPGGPRTPRPRLLAPRVLGPRTPTPPQPRMVQTRPRFVPRPPANLRPPARQQSPAAQVKSGVKPIQAMLGQQVVTVQMPKKLPDIQPRTTSKLSQLLSMPKTMKASQSPLAPKTKAMAAMTSGKRQSPGKKQLPKPRVKLSEVMDMDFEEPSEESEGEPVTPAFTGPDKTPSPLGSPLPLTLCPETGKILGQAEGEPTPLPSPEPGNILPDMEPPDEEESVMSRALTSSSSHGHDYAQLASSAVEPTATVKTEAEEGEGEYVTITGDDGVLYQIATNGANLVDGETMLMTEDGQQCVYVSAPSDEANMLSLDTAVAEAVAQLGDSIGANSQIVMRGGDGGQILMTTGEEGAEERAAQVVAHIVEEGESGGMRRVVLLLPDGNFMMTEVDEQQYAALDLEK